MTQVKHILVKYLKGVFIGIGTIIPGVSGGTVAVLISEFENILEAFANIMNHMRRSIATLLPIITGVACGILITSHPLSIFCERHPDLSKYCFCVISVLSAFGFTKKTQIHKLTLKSGLLIITGGISAFLISFSMQFYKLDLLNDNLILIFFLGFPLALALVLPAISFSYMMLFFGIYQRTLNAISCLDVNYLFYLGSGVVIGSYVFSKLLLKITKSYSIETYSFVLGFLIYSIADIIV